MSKKVGVIGHGVIGRAITNLFKEKVELYIYDPIRDEQEYDYSNFNTTHVKEEAQEYIGKCDFAFICVPTNHKPGEGLEMSIVKSVVEDFEPKMFINCSTLQPGTADFLMAKTGKIIVVQPEYFGETAAHPLVNLKNQLFLILGGDKKQVNKVISLYQQVYNANIKIRVVSALEAEIIKLSENRAIAYKVAQCQELYDVCKKANIDYNTIREAVYGDDPRFNLWWTFIYEDDRGMNSKCLPKDVYGWEAWAKEVGAESELTSALLKYNDKLINLEEKENE